jgi:chemotaxis response regulator CheB
MPQAAAASGALDELLPLDRIGERIVRFARGT